MPMRPYLVSPFLMTVPLILYSNNSVLNFLLAEPAAIMFPPAMPGPRTIPIGVELVCSGTPYELVFVV